MMIILVMPDGLGSTNSLVKLVLYLRIMLKYFCNDWFQLHHCDFGT